MKPAVHGQKIFSYKKYVLIFVRQHVSAVVANMFQVSKPIFLGS